MLASEIAIDVHIHILKSLSVFVFVVSPFLVFKLQVISNIRFAVSA